MARVRIFSWLITLLALALVAGACGADNDDKIEPTVTRVMVTEPATEPTVSTELAPDEITAGAIADLIAAAWPSVVAYTSVTEILPIASGSPVASPESGTPPRAERQVILPATKRIAITDLGTTTEIVLINGVISKRVTDPNGVVGAWETIDPANVAQGDPFANTYQSMLQPEQPPYSGLGQRQREQIGTQTGDLEINGRTCRGYTFPTVSDNGEQITIQIYLDDQNLPCRIDTTAHESLSRTDYLFNQPIDFATPVASPVSQT